MFWPPRPQGHLLKPHISNPSGPRQSTAVRRGSAACVLTGPFSDAHSSLRTLLWVEPLLQESFGQEKAPRPQRQGDP
jgi:hypothetical protein